MKDATDEANAAVTNNASAQDVADAQAKVAAAQATLDSAKAAADIDAARAAGAKKRAEDKKKEAEAKKKAVGMTTTPSPQSVGPDAPLNTCKDMQSSWDRFKAECDRTQSWDRPGTDCNGLLRRANGCVDVREIYPKPDDTSLSCLMLSVDEETLLQEACKERQKVASAIEPGTFNCGRINRDFVRNDPGGSCGRPDVIVTEDQCLNLPDVAQPGPITGGNPPRPVANAWQWGKILIVDGLGLNGLGFGLPGNR